MRHIRIWEEIGLTQIEYCRRNILPKHRFTLWKCKRHKKDEPVKFVSLYPKDAIISHSLKDSGLRLIIGDSYRIEVGEILSEDFQYRPSTGR